MYIYECVNSSVAFNAITSAPEVRHALKCFVQAAPEHSLEACSIGNTQTKHLRIMDFKKVPAVHSSQDPGISCCSGNDMTGKQTVKEVGLGEIKCRAL